MLIEVRVFARDGDVGSRIVKAMTADLPVVARGEWSREMVCPF